MVVHAVSRFITHLQLKICLLAKACFVDHEPNFKTKAQNVRGELDKKIRESNYPDSRFNKLVIICATWQWVEVR